MKTSHATVLAVTWGFLFVLGFSILHRIGVARLVVLFVLVTVLVANHFLDATKKES